MATVDFPDFQKISLFNLMLQGLTPLINRPMYGEAISSSGEPNFTGAQTYVLTEIGSKGLIYGGFVHTEHANAESLDSVSLHVDGNTIASKNFSQLVDRNIINPQTFGTYLLSYDTDTPRYSLGIMNGITFEEEFEVWYVFSGSGAMTVDFAVIYAVV